MSDKCKEKKREDYPARRFNLKKNLLMAKWVSVFTFVLCLTASANVYSQQRVNLNVQSATLSDVLMQITEQTGMRILYNENQLEGVHCADMVLNDLDVEMALVRVLNGTGFTFVKELGVYVIQPDDEKDKVPATVSGRVLDESDVPLPGVTIIIKGTSVGTATDVHGRFQMPVDSSSVLLFTFIGMESQEVKYTGQDSIIVRLKTAAEEIGEVIVTGYQGLDPKTAVGAYSSVKGEDLIATGTTSLEQMLQGKVPGMMVMSQSGLTGARQKVRVRGTSTILGNSDPVWVVDGIIQEDPLPFEMQDFNANLADESLMRDFVGGAIDWLNPSEIERIDVLKDAAATAIYGTKAANGVIVITTKRGEKGKPVVRYYGRYSMSLRLSYNRMEIMNSQERVELSREAFRRGARVDNEQVGYTALALAYLRGEITREELETQAQYLETVNTDWFDILYCNPFSQEHSVSVSGGDNNATYRASVSYNETQNTARGNNQKRYRGAININARWGTKFTLYASLSGAYSKTKAFATGVVPYSYALNTSRVVPCYDENGERYFYNAENGYRYNILHELDNSGNENTSSSINVNVNLNYNLTDELRFRLQVGGARSTSFAEEWFTEYSNNITALRGYEYGSVAATDPLYQSSTLPFGGSYKMTESRNFNYTMRLQADWVKSLDLHTISLMAGWEIRSTQYDGFKQLVYGYQPDRGKLFVDLPLNTSSGENGQVKQQRPTITDRLTNTASYYVSAAWNWNQRYALSMNVRGDASNRFGQDERDKFTPIWSAGLRWNISEEGWITNIRHIFSDLSLMATFGYQGNLSDMVSPDLIASYNGANFETGEVSMSVSKRPTSGLKWEKTQSVDLNLGWSLFKNRISGNFSWYWKKTTDLISEQKVALENGVETTYINRGDMVNEGWDMYISLVPVRTENFTWSLSTTFSHNSNEVQSPVTTAQPTWENATEGAWLKEGYPVGAVWAFRYAGLNPENGGPLIDVTGIERPEAYDDPSLYLDYVGQSEPTSNIGVNMVLRYKRLSIPLSIYYVHGGKQFLPNPYTKADRMPSELTNVSSELNKRWRQPGDENHTNIPGIPVRGAYERQTYEFEEGDIYFMPYEAWGLSTARVVDVWYIRFNDFSFSYDLPERWIRGFAESVRISAYASNPLQIKSKDFKGRDPEVAMGSQPRERTFSIGLDIQF